jgi:hypothetical protein
MDAGAATDECRDADGEIVWSWRPDAGVKFVMLRRASWTTGTIKPVPEESAYKP